MTQEQYERLKPYEKHFDTAYHSNYLRNLGMTVAGELDTLYTEIIGPGSKLKSGCSRCVLESVKELAQRYYSYKPAVTPTEQPIKKTRQPKKKDGTEETKTK